MFRRSLYLYIAVIVLVSLSAFAAPVKWGVGNEGADPSLQYQALKDAGVSIVRLMISMERVNGVEGVYDWSAIDANVAGLRAAGLTIYADFMWLPAHATGGVPAYAEYTAGCTEWDIHSRVFFEIGDGPQFDNGGKTRPGIARSDRYRVPRGGTITIPAPGVLGNDDARLIASVTKEVPRHGSWTLNMDGSFTYKHDGSDAKTDVVGYWTWGLPHNSMAIHFEWEQYEYCRNPPRLDVPKFQAFVRRFVERYKDDVEYYGFGNEPEYGIYWPPRRWEFGNEHVPDLNRFIEDGSAPFAVVIREGDPTARIVGPETGSPDVLKDLLAKERASGSRWYDVVSVHAYSWGEKMPEAIARKIDEWFVPVMNEYGEGRKLWLSETGPDGLGTELYHANYMAFAKNIADKFPLEAVIIHNSSGLFEADGRTPNALYEEFRKFNEARKPRKRRSVRSFLVRPTE